MPVDDPVLVSLADAIAALPKPVKEGFDL
jgi:hypothetical protein